MSQQTWQDWTPVVWSKQGTKKPTGANREKEVIIARRKGEEIQTEKKFMGGQNKSTKHICPNAAKLEEDTGEYHVERVSFCFSKALQQARTNKGMTQVQLAQAISEKASVINDYESGKAVPDGNVVQKLGRVLGCKLPPAKEKVKPAKE